LRRSCAVITAEAECWAEGRDVRGVVVSGVLERTGKDAKAGAEGGMRQELRLVSNADARIPVIVLGGHQLRVQSLVSGEDHSLGSVREDGALLSRNPLRAASTGDRGRRIRIPANANGQGQVRLDPDLVLCVSS